ncbi:GYD domain-containing protein [Actinomycetospora chlora]|jgi:uncharacterized protein with GYD domain|uniref:GYD domain-containing protein n=1 Tax=Actinomycetospora chlora TaxID=663608 RepID=A0ABP9AHL2_9PSEU
MTRFITFFNYTEETWAKMIVNPSDRLAAVRAAAESLGGTVDTLYYMFGRSDGFVISEVPDSTSAAAFSIAVTASGAVRDIETHELIAPDDLPAVLGKAATAQGTYRPPGS